MPPASQVGASIRDSLILVGGALATAGAALSGFSAWIALFLGIATTLWALARLNRRPTPGSPGIPFPSAAASPIAEARSDALEPSDLHLAADAVDDIVLVFSPEGPVRASNSAARAFFGAESTSLARRTIEDLLPQAELLELHEAARARERRECEVAITGRDGRRVFRAIARPIGHGNEPPAVLLLLRDVTAYQSALRLGGDFVASVSHEMRTPLASIKAALETLEQSVQDDPAMTHRLLGMIGSNADRLEALTADVLRLSHLESSEQKPEFAEVEVRPVLDSIASLLDPLFSERGLTLSIDIAPELGTITTDPRLFELIFKNLLENAGKFAFENSAITVRGRAGDSPGSQHWRVIDRGVGIPLHHQARIFDRFYQVDAARTGSSKRRGTGLGLAIVQNAVRALGGTIRVESVWQQGTTMIVDLPAPVSSPSRPNSPGEAWS